MYQHRPPPVKLRLEYPVYSTEGGLTRGCLKVLANQASAREATSGVPGLQHRGGADERPPPVKLRLEYPVYSTEGGLTRGCLKVLANQVAMYQHRPPPVKLRLEYPLEGMAELPLPVVKAAWQGFCLDPTELRRIFCLCEVFMRKETVPFLHFIAVAAGLLTK
ncbi:putative Si:rp71-1f1.7, partial [Operophtera brumata]